MNAISVDRGDICMANIDDYTTVHSILNTKHNTESYPDSNGDYILINFILSQKD